MPCSPRPDGRRTVLVLALALAHAGCVRPPAALPAAAGDPLATLRARGAVVRTLRATFTAVARVDEEARQARGVLLARGDEALRLRLVAPFGITVFDYTRAGNQVVVWLPEVPASGAPPDLALFARLGLDDLQPPADCVRQGAAGTPLVLYRCARPGGSLELTIDAATATLRTARDVVAGATVLTRTYDDYAVVDGVPLPHHLHVRGVGTDVEVHIDAYALNPVLPADAFVPPPGAVPVAAPAAS